MPPAPCRPLLAALNATLLALCLALTPPSLATPAPTPAVTPAPTQAVPWDSGRQGGFVTALTGDRQGHVWAATEDNGVWEYSPSAPVGKQWTQFTTKNTSGGLGDDDIYSLTCDKLGRIWAGTGRDGVSVWSGREWKTYDRLTGPLGCHVTALATSPLTGDVWGCTDSGLFSYALKTNAWHYYTRADGLPSDQATCLAFTRTGTLLIGTDCDGIAIGSPADDYKTWRVVKGPDAMPATLRGSGLPTSLINCLLVSREGTVYAGTTTGLARSENGGQTWRFVRGTDWKDKLAGLYHPITPQGASTGGLLEDYVTSLAEDGAGHLYVGHRQKGLEVLDALTGARVDDAKSAYGGFVDALLPTGSGRVFIGTYGDGLKQTSWPAPPAAVAAAKPPAVFPALPSPAKPPTAAQLGAMLRQVRSEKNPLPVGRAAYLGEDWQTQGDWVGRYGRQYARLLAMQSPFGDHFPFVTPGYMARPQMGPHHHEPDALRFWVTWVQTDNPKSLYDPVLGYARQAEADDHGESGYGYAFAGPDIWIKVSVPEGIHRVSLYDVNKDGHDGDNRYRDYTVEVKTYQDTTAAADDGPALAHARIRNFWGGEYVTFLVRGPDRYWIKIGRNYSLNTLCAAVFIDRVTSTAKAQNMDTLWLGGVRYDKPQVSEDAASPAKQAEAFWSALDDDYNQSGGLTLQQSYRLFAYRAATDAATPALLANWRWTIHLWTPSDRQVFTSTMSEAYQALLTRNPELRTARR